MKLCVHITPIGTRLVACGWPAEAHADQHALPKHGLITDHKFITPDDLVPPATLPHAG